MKISANEASRKIEALNIIPLADLAQATRIKIIRAQVEFEKALNAFQNDLAEGLKKLKPDGFDDKLGKFSVALKDDPTEEEKAKVEELKKDADWEAFKAEYDKVNAEYSELSAELAKEEKHEVIAPAFTDADWEDIAKALPSDKTTTIKRGDKEYQEKNDAIVFFLMQVFG